MPVNGESKQWHERPAIVKFNLKSILVFVKHPPDLVEILLMSELVMDRVNHISYQEIIPSL